MSRSREGLVRSVHVRLVRHAKELGVDPNLVLTRFAVERFLYRLSRSPYVDRFVLKGAMLLVVWLGEELRPTRDADLLGFGDLSADALARIFTEVCGAPVEPDAMTYDPATIRVNPIRREDRYGGQRVVLEARLGSARMRVQVDVGIGDIVTPAPQWLEYPSLLDLPRPRLRAYAPEVAVAEKLHAMVILGATNSRMRDFFDVYALAARHAFDGERLENALRATFERRKTPVPETLPIALTTAFVEIEGKETQWQAFLRRGRIAPPAASLDEIVRGVARFLAPVLAAARERQPFRKTWPIGGPWQAEQTREGSGRRG